MALSPPALAGDRPVAPIFRHLPPAAAAVDGLGPHDCRWPSGEPADGDFAFCGGPRMRGGSYCALHARLARTGANAVRGARA